jgi:hypothetical protein
MSKHLAFLSSAVEMEVNEENQKKVPRARKANFSMLEESILLATLKGIN